MPEERDRGYNIPGPANPKLLDALMVEDAAHQRGVAGRRILYFRDGLKLSVLLCPCTVNPPATPRWSVRMIPPEANYVTLICRCTLDNKLIKDSYVFPNIERTGLFRLKENDRWLKKGKQLSDLSKLRHITDQLRAEVSVRH